MSAQRARLKSLHVAHDFSIRSNNPAGAEVAEDPRITWTLETSRSIRPPCRLPLTLNEVSEPASDRSWRSGQADHRAIDPTQDGFVVAGTRSAGEPEQPDANDSRCAEDHRPVGPSSRCRRGRYVRLIVTRRIDSGRRRADSTADPSSASITLAKLQNPVKQSFDVVNGDLKDIYNGLGRYQKVLDKV